MPNRISVFAILTLFLFPASCYADCTFKDIRNKAYVNVSCPYFVVNGLIDDQSRVFVTSVQSSTIAGKVDGASKVSLDTKFGPISIKGPINGHSVIVAQAARGDINVVSINGGSLVELDANNDSVGVSKGIDGASQVAINASKGSITIGDKIDGRSTVSLSAPNGSITIGTVIDGGSKVCLKASGNITIGDRIGTGPSESKTEIWWEGAGFAVAHGTGEAVIHPRTACPIDLKIGIDPPPAKVGQK